MTLDRRDSAPGTSGNSERRRTRRPERTSPRIRIEANRRRSILAPLMTMPILRPRKLPGGAGAFGDQLLLLDQQFDRAFELLFIDQADVGDERLDDAARQTPRLLDR